MADHLPNGVRVQAETGISPALLGEVAVLVRHLSSSAEPPDAAALSAIVESPGCQLLVARDADGAALGMLTLVVFRIPTGVRAMIEDVVTSPDARGRGVGEALVREAIARAKEAGARTVDLTSRPSREAANRLYLRTGFVRRDTNCYRAVP